MQQGFPLKVPEATFKQKLIGQVNAFALPRMMDLLNLRIFHYDRSADPARPEYNQHVILVFWHEYIGVALPQWRHTSSTALCSQHRDGELVNQTAISLGLHIVRGSTTRGGSQAIRQLKKSAQYSSLVLTPDGPRGPRREMAAGPIYLASLFKMPIVPVAVGIDRPYRLKTWDKFAIPRPFSRVRIVFGPKITIPTKASRDKLEACRTGVQRLMNDLTDQAERWAGSREKRKGEQIFLRARRTSKKIFASIPNSPSVPDLENPKRKAA